MISSGGLGAALQAYQRAVALQNDFADGWNNLAQVALELGQLNVAGDAIDRAVGLGGVRLAQYLHLQAEIARLRAQPTAPAWPVQTAPQ